MKPKIREIALAYPAEPNVPLPELRVSDGETILTYATHWDCDTPYAEIAFSGVLVAQLGYPNDEALRGHPLYPYGLRWYTFQEVLASPWIAEIRSRNEVPFPKVAYAGDARHFVYTFHDETFEGIADSFELRPLTLRPG